MCDKTTIGNNENAQIPSKAFREYIESLVEEIVLNNAVFNDHKKYLQRYSQEEGLDYAELEKNLMDFFEVMGEWNRLKSKSSQLAAKMLAKNCHLSEETLEILLTTEGKTNKQNVADDHEYVDLGLPSGTLWAICNVGATKPEDFGDHFAWGEVNTKSTFSWDTYKNANNASYKTIRSRCWCELTKYCSRSEYGNNGFTDNLTELQTIDDPATSNWGKGWRTPSKDQWDELLAHTISKWKTCNGVIGQLFTSKKNGHTLFLPAAGFCMFSESDKAGFIGDYWSRSLKPDDPIIAWYLHSNSESCTVGTCVRVIGYSVRPVRQK